MAERDAQFLQIGLGHIGQDLEIDGILGKDGRVLPEPDLIEPSRYPVIDAHCRTLTIIGSRCASLWRFGAGVTYAWSRSVADCAEAALAMQAKTVASKRRFIGFVLSLIPYSSKMRLRSGVHRCDAFFAWS
jgi:hypothetical protein